MSLPVKLLFLGANPADATRLSLGEEAREIGHRLRPTELAREIELSQEWAVRPADLQECLLRHRPRIVHFGGQSDRDGQLLLQDEEGKGVPVGTEALAALFRIRRRDIRCVVLSACYSRPQAHEISRHI